METRFLNASTVIESLRDNGYTNTAYALAELIDNSIQAEATRVEVGFIEEKVGGSNNRSTYNVTEISLWDNGKGMSPDELRLAMQFGGSKHRENPTGMGKFGMGLPNSSISQCRRVDVWSWNEGGQPHHTYLDIDEMKNGKLEVVPNAKPLEIPTKYSSAFFEQRPKSGTVIIWSNLDRLNWKTGKSNYKHCEYLVGRMYRKFLSDNKVKVKAITYRPDSNDSLESIEENYFQANDPMYLMKKTSLPPLPGKYEGEAFFELIDRVVIPIDYIDLNNEKIQGDVTITTSIAKESIARYILESESGKSSLGGTNWGKHCAKNIGVSVMRAGRELVLRDSFISADIRQHKARFIGVEVSFPPSLDRVFGVTNNKQDAVKFVPYDINTLSEQADFKSEQEYRDELKENQDPLFYTLEVITKLMQEIKKAESKLELLPVQRQHFKSSESDISTAAEIATKGAQKREERGESIGNEEQAEQADLEDLYREASLGTEQEIQKKAQSILESGVKFAIEVAPRDSDAFFDVSTKKGMTLVVFNSNHIFHKDFISKLPDDQLSLMQTAIAGFARVMNETTDKRRLDYLNTVRRDWGKVITDFLDDRPDGEEFF